MVQIDSPTPGVECSQLPKSLRATALPSGSDGNIYLDEKQVDLRLDESPGSDQK